MPTPRVKGGPPVHSLTPKGRRPCPRHMRRRPPVCRGACGPTPTGSNPLSPPSPSHRDEGGARVDAAGEGGTSGPLSHAERASTVPTPHATQTAPVCRSACGPGNSLLWTMWNGTSWIRTHRNLVPNSWHKFLRRFVRPCFNAHTSHGILAVLTRPHSLFSRGGPPSDWGRQTPPPSDYLILRLTSRMVWRPVFGVATI